MNRLLKSQGVKDMPTHKTEKTKTAAPYFSGIADVV
jgi:hypothetical protein